MKYDIVGRKLNSIVCRQFRTSLIVHYILCAIHQFEVFEFELLSSYQLQIIMFGDSIGLCV